MHQLDLHRTRLDAESEVEVICGTHLVYVDVMKKILTILDAFPEDQRPHWKDLQVVLHVDAFAPFIFVNKKKHNTVSFQLLSKFEKISTIQNVFLIHGNDSEPTLKERILEIVGFHG